MPVEFLTDEQAAAYGSFAGAPTRAELERFFFLDDQDRRMVERRRRNHNRVGFGLQLGTVRILGRFLDEPTAVPSVVVDYVAEQLGVDDPSCVKVYGERPQTVLEHVWEIRRAYGYREFTEARVELSSWLDARAWTTGDGPKALFIASVEWLLKRKVLLPGVTTLTRVVSHAREQTTARLWECLFGLLDDQKQRKLERLLDVTEDARMSDLERLRQGPKRVSGPQMKAALQRVAEVAHLGFVGFDASVVPPRRLAELSRYGMACRANVLRRHPPQRRYATMLATVICLHARSVDDALDLFDVLMATNLLARAERKSKKERLRTFPKLAVASSKLAAVVKVIIAAAAGAQDVPLSKVLAEIEAIASTGELSAAVTTVGNLTPADDSDMDEAWRAELVERFRTVRPFLVMLTEVIEFDATAEGSPVLAAMRRLPTLLGRKKVSKDEIDASLLVGSWRRLILAAPDLEKDTIDRRAYVFCILELFWRHLLRREIHAVHSTRWSDPRAKLLAGRAWEKTRPTVLASLDLSEDPGPHLAERARLLDETYRQVAGRLGENTSVTFDSDGRLHVGALTAEPDPASLVELRAVTERMLPRVELSDVLLEVAI